MIRRFTCVSVLVFMALVGGCTKKPVDSSSAPSALPSRASAPGEFPDNPMLANIPADTPYAFATFKPVSPEFIHTISALFGPIWRRVVAEDMTQAAGAEDLRALVEEMGHLDAKRFEELGFSMGARTVVYGVANYPVVRFELSSGERVLALAQRLADRHHEKLPPGIAHGGGQYWIIDLPISTPLPFAALISVAPKELVAALAPRPVIDANVATILGDQRPAKAMTTAQFRDIAARDGFTGQGVGFVDLARVGQMVANAIGVGAECRAAIDGLTKRVPRVAIGYDDLTAHRMAGGMVFELAPDLLAELRGLSSSLPGFDRVVSQKPAMAFAVALNVDRGRGLLTRIAGVVQDVGQRCHVPGAAAAADKLTTAATRPLPPAAQGIHGGFAVVNNIEIGPQGPTALDGFGLLQLDHAADLLKLAAIGMPGFDAQADGKAHALPPKVPLPGHYAANDGAIGFAMGQASATAVVDVLKGAATPAPFAMMAIDYGRLGPLMLASSQGRDAQNMRDVIAVLGLLTMQVLADDRGFVLWSSFELR